MAANVLGTPGYNPSLPPTQASGQPLDYSAWGDPFAAFKTPGASYLDPQTGEAVQGDSSSPVGVAAYQSSQLVQDPTTGATYSATGTKANPFAGFVSANGGGFGADPATAEPNRGVLMDAVSNDPSRIASAINSTDPAPQQRAVERLTDPTATAGNRLGALNDSSTAGMYNADWFKGLNPDAQAKVTAQLKAGGGDPAAIDRQLADLGAGGNLTKLGGDTSGTYQFKVNPASVDAANAASAAQQKLEEANAPPPPDADPFGRFDSASSPTHGVITPAYEKQLADQSGTLTAPPPNPALPPAQSSPTASAPVTAPNIPAPTPPVTPALSTDGGFMPPQMPPLVDPAISDPFAGFKAPPTDVTFNGVGNGGLPAPIGGNTDAHTIPNVDSTMSTAGFQPNDYGQNAATAPADGPGGVTRFRPIQSWQRPATGAFTNTTQPGLRPVKPAGNSLGGGASAPALY